MFGDIHAYHKDTVTFDTIDNLNFPIIKLRHGR